MDSQSIEQLHNEIQEELLTVLNQSRLSKVLEKHGISGQEILKIQYTLDLNKVQSSNDSQDKVAIESFSVVMKPPIEISVGLIRPCPLDGNPDGCWVNC